MGTRPPAIDRRRNKTVRFRVWTGINPAGTAGDHSFVNCKMCRGRIEQGAQWVSGIRGFSRVCVECFESVRTEHVGATAATRAAEQQAQAEHREAVRQAKMQGLVL